MGLVLASVLTLLLIFAFLAIVALPVILLYGSLMGLSGFHIISLIVGTTVLINTLAWLVSPRIADFIYKYFYRLDWISIEELRDRRPDVAAFVDQTCQEYGFRVPKLGVIPDRNLDAFTYGSGRWNSRLVITEGMFEYLDADELTAVYAHELGHIHHRDFIIMTIASTLLQLLFEFYAVLRDSAYTNDESAFDFQIGHVQSGYGINSTTDTGDANERGRENNLLLIAATIAYILYRIGTYAVLYLSRVREYYADEFAAKEADPNRLPSALLKTAYSILASPDNVRQVQSTKLIGLTDLKLAKNTGLAYYNAQTLGNQESLERSLLYDFVNPWAFVTELTSPHPLTGKRIRRLSQFSDDPLFDFQTLGQDVSVDRRQLYRGFLRDLLVTSMPTTAVFALPFLYFGVGTTSSFPIALDIFFGGWITLVGLTVILRTLYAFPGTEPQATTVTDLMGDLYASPVRGRAVELDGELVGRGVPGLIVAEDMLVQDETGLMFVDYQGFIPVLGNLFFGLRRVAQLIGQEAKITGWFRRGSFQWIGLRRLVTTKTTANGFVKTGGLLRGGLLMILGLAITLVL